MPTVACITLGCKVNQWDTQAIREALARRGFAEVAADQPADLYIVNTCCVTRESHRKSLRLLRRFIRERPEAVVIAAGCSVDAYPAAFRRRHAGLLRALQAGCLDRAWELADLGRAVCQVHGDFHPGTSCSGRAPTSR